MKNNTDKKAYFYKPNMTKKYTGRVPACGVFCGGCPNYIREKNPCPGADINHMRCEKCKTFHLCCRQRGIAYCYECSVFPCSKFRSFAKRWLKYGQDFIENQKRLKESGSSLFLEYYNNLVEIENMEIRKVTLNEIEQLQYISRKTFWEAFAADNTEENMNKYLEEGFSLEKLTSEINNEHSVFYFAVSDDEIIGYLKLNFGGSQTELKDTNALEIERIYVLPQFHGKKVGQALYEKALQIAGEIDADYIWLGVWEENTKAIRFYKKNGFVEFDKHLFMLGDDEQTDILMKLELKNS